MSSLAVRTPEATSAALTPVRSIIYLGMDVHKDSITIDHDRGVAAGREDADAPRAATERSPDTEEVDGAGRA